MLDIRQILKDSAKEHDMNLKELASKVPTSYEGLLNKLRRESITVKDLEKILNVVNKELTVTDKTQQDKTPPTRK